MTNDTADRDDDGAPADRDVDLRSPALLRALAASPLEIARMIQELHRRVHDEDSLLDLMARTSREAVRMIVDARWAGVTAELNSAPFTAAHTDDRVLIIDEGQYGQGDGPCLSAARTGSAVAMTAAEVHAKWPHLGELADTVGVGSFRGEPLHSRDMSVGSLNLYSTREDGIRIPDPDILTVLVEYLDRGLSDYSLLQPEEEQAWRLKRALVAREVIQRAVGVLMALHDLSDEQAWAVLAGEAERRLIAPAIIAAEVLEYHARSKS